MAIKSSLTSVRDIFASPEAYSQKSIQVGGWVKGLRASNAFGFIELNDGTCFKNLQVVFESEKLENYKSIAKQNIGASMIVTGILELTPGAKQPFELKAEKVEVTGESSPEYPLQPKRHSFADRIKRCADMPLFSAGWIQFPEFCAAHGDLQ